MVVTDATGRTLHVRRLNALDKLRLFKAVGPTLAQNGPYLGMAVLACAVTEVDGVPMPVPASEAQIEAAIARLGDAGIEATSTALDTLEQPASLEDNKALAGN